MKVLQNSFVGGEIAPNLFGRTDIEVYSHAAKNISNFEVCKTGGLRKRQGTQLLWYSHNENAIAYRFVSYFYDRTRYGGILLYVKDMDSRCYYRILNQDGTVGEECIASLLTLNSASQLQDLNIKQIGDTFFFARKGFRCVKAFYNYVEGTLEWSELEEQISVADTPEMVCTSSGFEDNPTEGYVETFRKYGLIGVKDGVYSKVQEKNAWIWLPWVASAKVEIEFTPAWHNHDSYILTYQYAGDWGVISTFFPSTEDCESSGTTKTDNGAPVASAAISGIEYLSGSVTPTTAWNGNPNTLAEGANYHSNAIIIAKDNQIGFGNTIVLSTTEATPILGVKVWFGGKLRRASDTSIVDTVGTSKSTKLKLLDASGNTITSWNVIPAYSESYQELTIPKPIMPETSTYHIAFEGEDNVVIRDIFLLYDNEPRVFIDNNIVPGSTAGVMQPIGVGDSGMDIDIVDVWEQRLVLASSVNLPFTMWFSQVGNIGNFYTSRPQTTADAFSVTIPTTAASRILHTITSRWFMLFTESGEFSVDSAGSGFGFDSITIKKTSAVGAHGDIQPVVTESTVLFVAADGRSVYELAYKLEQDSVVPVNRSILAPHLTAGSQIKTIAYAKFPEPRLIALLDDGSLLEMTYLPEQSVYAWSRHNFGGSLKCVDVQCQGSIIEGEGLESTSLVLLTFIDTSDPSKVWVERFRANSIGVTQDIGKAKCADHCGYTEEQYPNGVDPQANVQASVTTLRPEGDQLYPMGVKRSTYETVLRLNNSGEVTLRPDIDGIEAESSKWHIDIPQVNGNEVTLLTKDAKVLPRVHTNSDGRMVIESSDGWPCEILSILYNYE